VSVVGVGTWQFGGEWGHRFTQPEVDAILDTAAELGINLIDTAECYGDHLSESLIGDYLSRRDRSKWIVATKFGHRFHSFMNRTDDYSTEGARQQLEASLAALKIDTIDVYQYHSGPDARFDDPTLWQFLDEAKQAGRIRHIGISIKGSGSEPQARRARSVGAEMLQVIYNRLDRRPEEQYFPHAERDNLGIFARVPLASGLLTGKYKPGTHFAPTEYRGTLGQERIDRDLAEVEKVRSEVPEGVPMAQWALAWCLQKPVVTAVIPGCKSPDQVRSNAAAVELVRA
jgi:aryl-alcohol dehydrogenase-like predicted oxidoreductase